MGSLIYPRAEKLSIKLKCDKCKRRAEYKILFEGGIIEVYCLKHFYQRVHEIWAITVFSYACEKAKEHLKKGFSKSFLA